MSRLKRRKKNFKALFSILCSVLFTHRVFHVPPAPVPLAGNVGVGGGVDGPHVLGGRQGGGGREVEVVAAAAFAHGEAIECVLVA